jgi:hypothetical protein
MPPGANAQIHNEDAGVVGFGTRKAGKNGAPADVGWSYTGFTKRG